MIKGMSDKVAGKGYCYFWQGIAEEDSQWHKTWTNQGSKPYISTIWRKNTWSRGNISAKTQPDHDYSPQGTTNRSMCLGEVNKMFVVKRNYKMEASGEVSCCKMLRLIKES